VITGTGLLYDFLKTGTIFWENEKQVRFSGKMKNKYDFLEKVHFSEKCDFLALPKKAGAQVRIYVCAPFGND